MKLENNLYKIEEYQPDKNSFQLSLIKDCLIYKCHFPEQAITPGVCIIQIVTELLAKILDKDIEIDIIPNAKFIKAIEPEKNPEIEVCFKKIEETEDGKSIKINAVVENNNEIFSKITAIYK